MNAVNTHEGAIQNLPLDEQYEKAREDEERLGKQTPLFKGVMRLRRDAMKHAANPYDNPYDRTMWDIIRNSYDAIIPAVEHVYPSADGRVRFRWRLFLGMSADEDPEVLQDVGVLGAKLYRRPAGHNVQTVRLFSGRQQKWHVRDVNIGPRAANTDVKLVVEKALSVVKDAPSEEETLAVVSFRNPSRNDGAMTAGNSRTTYSQSLLRELFTAAKGFDDTYRHLPELYAPLAETSGTELPAARMSG